MHRTRTAALCAVLLCAVGCGGDDDDKKAGTGGSAGSGATGGGGTGGGTGGGGAGGGSGKTISYSGEITEFVLSGNGNPLEGVSMCVLDRPEIPCATTDAAGKYALSGVPAGVELGIIAEKTGYQSSLAVALTPDTDQTVNGFLVSDAVAQLVYGTAGFTWPLNGEGTITVAVQHDAPVDGGAGDGGAADAGTKRGGMDGATVSLTPASGKGPVYTSAAGTPDKAATSTSTSGIGVFGNVPAGQYEIGVSHPTKTCAIDVSGWPTGKPNSARAPARDNTVTGVVFYCQ